MVMFIHRVDEVFDPEKYFDTVPLHQGLFFRRWQERYGRNVVTLVADDSDGRVRVYAQCVEYVLPVVGSVWVVARGPLGSFDSDVSEEAFYKELCSLCTEVSPKTSHVRFQKKPSSERMRVKRAEIMDGCFMPLFTEQAVSLDRDFDDVAEHFSGNVARVVRRYTEGKCEDVQFHIEKTDFKSHLKGVYALLKESASIKKVVLHPYAYYEALFDELDANPEYGMLVLGYVGEHKELVAFVSALYIDSDAHHLFAGASSVGYENNMLALALYTALKEAKEQDIKRYNLGSFISCLSSGLGNSPVFSEGFGSEKVSYEASYDVVVSGWRYFLFRFLRLRLIIMVRRLLTRFYRAVEVELTSED